MLTALAFLLLAGAAQDPRPGAEPDGNKLVRVELVAERAKIHPGEHFALAAQLSVSRGWHIYWGENAGDTGVPTRLELDVPKGFEAGPARFPVPLRHEDPGQLTSFVHEGVVLVLFDVVAPAKLEPGAKLDFSLSAKWLVCTSRCFEGEGEASLQLESAAAGEPVPANEALFKDARAKLPRPLSELKGLNTGVKIDVLKREECVFEVSAPSVLELSFMPADQRDPAFVSAATTAGEKGPSLDLLYRWKNAPKGDQQIGCPGILNVKSKEGTASYWFDHKYFAGYGN